MRFILLATLLSCYKLHEHYSNIELQPIILKTIQSKIHNRHFIVGLQPSTANLLKSIAWLYRNESIDVGLWNQKNVFGGNDVIPWDNSVSEFDKPESKIAFFPRIPLDRKCLIKADISIKAFPVKNEDSLTEVIKFLNDECFFFVDISGNLQPAGQHRNEIVKKLYTVSKKGKNGNPVKCERVSAPKTRQQFAQSFLFRSKPVIIENSFNDWSALRKWSNDFLREKYGNKRVHVKLTPDGEFEGCDLAQKFDNFNTFKVPEVVKSQLAFPDLVVVRPAVGNMKFCEFLDLVENNEKFNNISAYLEYSSIRQYFPELEDDLKELPFLDGLLKLSHLNIWLSNGKTLGKLHFDPFDNILCQLRGNKKFTIFEPHNNYNLYEAHIQEAVLTYNPNTKKFRDAKLLDSTSMVMSPVDILNPDYARFPNFTKATSMECFLNEGDALYLPSFWWHEVQSYPNNIEGRNLAVNFWYEPFFTKEFPCIDCKLDVNPMYKNVLKSFP